ncbi:RICIN domain-containing protein [Spirilliplanes yamanashiensis]|uniref:Ricin B lectin domain-containing protein n=1 Tax=Spirilliplanes yamanashiensis TaxID=42233 RepID=A0A8J4DKP7_9ACTN|nr:RICIN domain-containing protein [Spirilliplanes yamanashiensis]MDP9819078.1 hypothetical protein [Spirilliplanes yamanashiensis]GIJ05532.1 hypothetical protein Sya03_48840 [Spirilliplanes yamanashiensis]
MFRHTRRLATVLTGLTGLAAAAAAAAAGTAPAAAAPVAAAAVTPPAGYTQIASGAGGRLEVAMASAAVRQPIVQGRTTGDTAYRPSHWAFSPLDGHHRIVNRVSGLCLEALSGGTTAHTPLVQNTCGGGFAQQWTVTDAGSGYVTLRPRHATGKAAGAFYGFTYPGAPVVLDAVTGAGLNHQQFRFLPAS